MGDCFMNIEMNSYIREQFDLAEVDIRTYSPLTLAYLGDEVFDMVIRTAVVAKGNTKPHLLHQKTSKIVKATTQAKMIDAIEELLTEEEKDINRRGRNAKSATMAKHASMAEYRKATGFEALLGYLYLQDKMDRIVELTKEGIARLAIDL